MEKFKKYATIGLFLLLIFGLLILHIALPDQELSYSERRKLETFPKATLLSIKDGSFLTVFYARPNGQKPAVILQQKWRMEK